MGMYDDFLSIIKYLKSDEQLLRLLYYPPDNGNDIVDPLDINLPNILDMDIEERSKITNLRIMKSAKVTDLENDSICRLYIYAGRRSPTNYNYLFANQELVIDILCHSNFENGDLRSTRITDRLNELFCQENLVGIGKMNFIGARQINAPYEYTGYQIVFEYSTFKR
ncbi:hypothetical protein JK635_01875 [Neobacillus sp. YIM B02564]|uniref:DUF3168 domain-containing protein n=1 Tax=Neobacillus paridis TaxID=2803862 RepID=A0ABS1TI88_9BACI|nr:hypothetical protein [Neobacillus paridis]MBL4950987.1 hypothetical protein [Neobacillus paridis]